MSKEIRNSIFNLPEGGSSGSRWTPPILRDGNTVAWYDSKDLTTLTKDATTGGVSRWNDKLGSGHDLIQVTATQKPIWSATGILFDGINDFLKTNTFSYIQPETIYLVVKRYDVAGTRYLIDGYLNSHGIVGNGDNVNVGIFVGSWSCWNAGVVNDEYIIICAVINNVNSTLRINNLPLVHGSPGVNNMDGITIGSNGAGNSNFMKMEIKEAIFRKTWDLDADSFSIGNYLRKKYNVSYPQFDSGKLVISFDDGWLTQYTKAFPLLVNKGVKGTFYVIGSAIGTAQYFNWQQVKEMSDTGMDIQCHTYDHADLTTLTEVQVIAELQSNNDIFVANNIPIPTVMAYPYGSPGANANVKLWVAGLRTSARGSTSASASNLLTPLSDRYDLPAYNITSISDADLISLERVLYQSSIEKSATIIYIHALTDADVLKMGGIIDLAKSMGIEIISHKELDALM